MKKFKILSIDGGGIRGVYSAYILKRIEETCKINLKDHFDLIAGTSTGSIIAAGIAKGLKCEELVELYQNYGSKIFEKKLLRFSLKGIVSNIYQKQSLEDVLKKYLGDTKLGEIDKPLLIPASDINNCNVHLFKSNYSPDFVRDKAVLLKDAVLASCSAPIYFKPECVGSYLLADGGLWCNNPALAAVIEAKTKLNVKLEDIKILSIGTGNTKVSYDVKSLEKSWWGFLTGWKHKKVISFILELQSRSVDNYLRLILSQNQILRINFESDKELPLDDSNAVSVLKSRADYDFTRMSKDIALFLKGE